jgi:hypothetical protein
LATRRTPAARPATSQTGATETVFTPCRPANNRQTALPGQAERYADHNSDYGDGGGLPRDSRHYLAVDEAQHLQKPDLTGPSSSAEVATSGSWAIFGSGR